MTASPLTEQHLHIALEDLKRDIANEFSKALRQMTPLPTPRPRKVSVADPEFLSLKRSRCASSFSLRPYGSASPVASQEFPQPADDPSFIPRETRTYLSIPLESPGFSEESSSLGTRDSGGTSNRMSKKNTNPVPSLTMSTFMQSNRRRSTWRFVTSKKTLDVEPQTKHYSVAAFVHSSRFENAAAFLVLVNSLMVGYEANYAAQHRGEMPVQLEYAETGFCIIFLTELVLRLYADRCEFFSTGGLWNCFDAFLVFCQVLDQLNTYMFKTFHLVRIFRSFRIVRALRMVHLFDELRSIVLSISSSLSSLGWAMALLAVNIYVFGVFFLQAVTDSQQLWKHEGLRYWFDGLGRTILTMVECIGGGVSWDVVINELEHRVSGVMALLFCFYIAMSIFAFMNLVTGLFVERIAVMVREDKDNTLTDCLEAIFADQEQVSEEVFQRELGSRTMAHFLKAIDVDSSEVHKLYNLMDPDGKGSVSKQHVTNFCRRLLGPAKSLDIAILLQEVSLIFNIVNEL